ncbi:TPA: hypothetical protein ACGO8F_000370 [Streptococcus suis]
MYYKLDGSGKMKLDKKIREEWEIAGITIVTAIITGWALNSLLILVVMLVSGLLFGLFNEDEENV